MQLKCENFIKLLTTTVTAHTSSLLNLIKSQIKLDKGATIQLISIYVTTLLHNENLALIWNCYKAIYCKLN